MHENKVFTCWAKRHRTWTRSHLDDMQPWKKHSIWVRYVLQEDNHNRIHWIFLAFMLFRAWSLILSANLPCSVLFWIKNQTVFPHETERSKYITSDWNKFVTNIIRNKSIINTNYVDLVVQMTSNINISFLSFLVKSYEFHLYRKIYFYFNCMYTHWVVGELYSCIRPVKSISKNK